MTISNGLIDGIGFQPSNNIGPKFAAGLPDTIVIHYTAGSSAASSIATLCDPNSKASAHLVIGRDGTITQLVPFDTIAWHAGKSQFGGRIGFNQYSIGIEIDNAGLLEKRGDKYYSWFNRTYPEDEVVTAVHRNQSLAQYWHAYTEAQLTATYEICRLLVAGGTIRHILGHEEISPGRKTDPGPAFPLDRFRERLMGGGRNEDTAEELTGKIAEVSIDLLNIRSGPSTEHEKIAKPLRKKQKVKILQATNGWVEVTTEITGWVSARHIQ